MAEEPEENGKQDGQEERQGEVSKLRREPGEESNDIKDRGDQLIESSEPKLPICDQR